MDARRIIIGDVHGHYDGLMTLLEALAPGQKDQVYFLGDLIDRGPKSAQVVEFVRQSTYHCLRGNHEQLMLGALLNGKVNPQMWTAWRYSGGEATVKSYVELGLLPNEHLAWIKTLPLYLDLGDVWLVHAGVDPTLPLEEQTQEQFCWIRREFHNSTKPYFVNKLIITGHTITFTFPGIKPGQIVKGEGWLDIDTGVYHPKSGWLTALDLSYYRVYQVNVFSHQVRILPFDEVVSLINLPLPENNFTPHADTTNHQHSKKEIIHSTH